MPSYYYITPYFIFVHFFLAKDGCSAIIIRNKSKYTKYAVLYCCNIRVRISRISIVRKNIFVRTIYVFFCVVYYTPQDDNNQNPPLRWSKRCGSCKHGTTNNIIRTARVYYNRTE